MIIQIMLKFISSSVINVCHYLADSFENEFMSTAGGMGLNVSGQISYVETIKMMSDIGLNISQLHILLRM